MAKAAPLAVPALAALEKGTIVRLAVNVAK